MNQLDDLTIQSAIPEPQKRNLARWVRWHGRWVILLSALLALVLWQALILWGNFPSFILPAPLMVAERFLKAFSDGTLLRNAAVTLMEVVAGLVIGSLLATILGYLLAKFWVLERLLSPYLVASQAIPLVAIAPLLVIWFGPGMFSKILICSLIVFFPVLVNTVVGLRGVPQNLRDLMRSMRATPLQALRFLEIPASLPIFLGGLRIGATLSVIGAVVGEFVGADRGLGFLINVGRGQYDTALVFVAIFTLISMALALYGLVVLLEKRLLAWQNGKTQ
ncbi:MAG: ABC transporter permease [Anaerolineaceae bacterium]|nr:ABC transporter permease [Anaerolineaceae bacterium]